MRLRRAPAAAALAAGVVTLLATETATAFVRSTVPSDDPEDPGPALFWCTRRPAFVLNDQGSHDAGAEASLAAVRRSFQTWTQPGCTDLTFLDEGTTARTDVGFDPDAADNVDLVVWREISCEQVVPRSDDCLSDGGCGNKYACWDHEANTIAITTTTFDNRSGEILDSDIELNGGGFLFTAVDGPPCTSLPVGAANECVATDVQNTVTHEIGHLLGLDHPPDPDTTMFASESLGETKKRDLSEDDIDGLCAIYPKGAPSSDACSQSSQADPGGGGGGTQNGCGCTSGPSALLSAVASLAGVGALLRRRRLSPRPRRTSAGGHGTTRCTSRGDP